MTYELRDDLRAQVARALYRGPDSWESLASSLRASLIGAADDLLAEHATWRDRWLNCACGGWRETDGGTHAGHVLAVARLEYDPDYIGPAELRRRAEASSEPVVGGRPRVQRPSGDVRITAPTGVTVTDCRITPCICAELAAAGADDEEWIVATCEAYAAHQP